MCLFVSLEAIQRWTSLEYADIFFIVSHFCLPRFLVVASYLIKSCPRGKSFKKRWFTLEGGALSYYASPPKSKSETNPKGTLSLKGSQPPTCNACIPVFFHDGTHCSATPFGCWIFSDVYASIDICILYNVFL